MPLGSTTENLKQVTGMLTLDDVGQSLNVSPVQVLRLIARKRLKSSRLNRNREMEDAGEWTVAAADLDAYVRSGAADLAAPFGMNDAWLKLPGHDEPLARGFEPMIVEASQGQRLSDGDVESLANSDKFATSFQVEIKRDAAINAVLSRPIASCRIDAPEGRRTDERRKQSYGSLSSLYLCARMQVVARWEVDKVQGLSSGLHRLYGSPEAYRGFVDSTIRRTLETKIPWSEFRKDPRVPDGGMYGRAEIRIQYVMPLSAFTSASALGALADRLVF